MRLGVILAATPLPLSSEAPLLAHCITAGVPRPSSTQCAFSHSLNMKPGYPRQRRTPSPLKALSNPYSDLISSKKTGIRRPMRSIMDTQLMLCDEILV
ncbi:unnamed protein product [Leptosia nina]|uniref:Secreted protein n=1 Tax=Leptosia nina TaxID=320188 RepID=A0AAV1JZ27_9NEOP